MAPKDAYTRAGVDYELLDEFKRVARLVAKRTHGYRRERPEQVSWSSVGLVTEAVGTKGIITETLYRETKVRRHHLIAQDAVAAIVNDIVAQGSDPHELTMLLLAGSSAWFDDTLRWRNLVCGWDIACYRAQCVWTAGETAVWPGVVTSKNFVLAGTGVGLRPPSRNRLGEEKIQPGDVLVYLGAEGIQTNGATLVRKICDKLKDGYLTMLPDGTMLGETLLKPAPLFTSLLPAWDEAGIDLHYLAPITGHGWTKILRPNRALHYLIHTLPQEQVLMQCLAEWGKLSSYQLYKTFAMGAGLMAYIAAEDVDRAVASAAAAGYQVGICGVVLEGAQPSRLRIDPLDLDYIRERAV